VAARMVELRVRVSLTAWMFVSCVVVRCVCSGLCDQLISRSESPTGYDCVSNCV